MMLPNFEQWFRTLKRIERELAQADEDRKKDVIRELANLRRQADEWMEHWLVLEDQIASLCEQHRIDLDSEEAVKEKPVSKNQGGEPEEPFSDETTIVWRLPPHLERDRVVRAFRRGVGFFELWMYNEAVRELEEVVRAAGDFPVARLYLAWSHLAGGRDEEAERHLQFLLSTEGSPWIVAAAHHARAQVLAGRRQWKEAADELVRAVEARPDEADLHFNLGVALFQSDRPEEALRAFSKVLELNPRDEDAWLSVIEVLEQMGRWKQAGEWAVRAYRTVPHSWRLGRKLALLLDHAGYLEEAKILWRRLVQWFPREAPIWTGLGWTRWRTGDRVGARGAWKKALCLDREEAQALFYLGWVEMEDRDDRAASRYLERAARDPDLRGPVQLAMGWVERERGNEEAAVSRWKEAARSGGVWGRWAVELLDSLKGRHDKET